MTRQRSIKGFSIIETFIVVALLVILSLSAHYIWKHHMQSKHGASSPAANPMDTQPLTNSTSNPYAGWKTYCDTSLEDCFRYPGDWIQSQFGGYQNRTDTAYVNYQDPNTKDQATETVSIVSLKRLSAAEPGLVIVGYVQDMAPGYAVYDSAAITNANIRTGRTVQLPIGNAGFSAKSGQPISLTATPGAGGLANIHSAEQAKVWFNTPEAKECLTILQSFSYK